MSPTVFHRYDESHFNDCLRLFDENCPRYFAENEREGYVDFLNRNPFGYFVGVIEGRVASAFGLITEAGSLRGRLSWILVGSGFKGKGLGVNMISVAKDIARENELLVIDIAASHLSAPFFAKFAAKQLDEILDGWGPGMHKINMQLKLTETAEKTDCSFMCQSRRFAKKS